MMRYSEEEKKRIEETKARSFQVRDQITIVLQNQGIKVDVSHRDYGLGAGINSLDDLSVNLEIKPQYSSYGMSCINNGKLTLSFGHYGKSRRKTFPEPNAGYNVNKICALLTEWLIREKELDEIEQKKQKQLDWLKEKVKELQPQLDRIGFSADIKWTKDIEISRLFSSPHELELFLQGIKKGNFSKGEKDD